MRRQLMHIKLFSSLFLSAVLVSLPARAEIVEGQQRIDILRQCAAANRANYENLTSLVVTYACVERFRMRQLPGVGELPDGSNELARIHIASRESRITWRWLPQEDIFFVSLEVDEDGRRYFSSDGQEIAFSTPVPPDPVHLAPAVAPIAPPLLGFEGVGLYRDGRFTQIRPPLWQAPDLLKARPAEMFKKTAIQDNRDIGVLEGYMRIPEKPMDMYCLGNGPRLTWQQFEGYAKVLAGECGDTDKSFGESYYRLESAKDGYRFSARHGKTDSPSDIRVNLRIDKNFMVLRDELFVASYQGRPINKPELQKQWTYRVVDGIYIPSLFHRTQYLPYDRDEPGKLLQDRKLRLIDAAVNVPIEPSELDFASIGIRDFDVIRNRSSQQEFVIQRGEPVVNKPKQRTGVTSWQSFGWSRIGGVALFMVCAMALGVYWFRRAS